MKTRVYAGFFVTKIRWLAQLKLLFVKDLEHRIQLMTAFQNKTPRRNNAELSLPITQSWRLDDLIKSVLTGFAINAKDGTVRQKVHGIVFPMSGADHAAVNRQYLP